jgi:pectate lyase
MEGGEAPADVDGDGMPDAWELAHGLDPADPRDGASVYGEAGYTALETYLDWIVRRGGHGARP